MVANTWPGVLFLIWYSDFNRTMGFYWTLLFELPVLMCFCSMLNISAYWVCHYHELWYGHQVDRLVWHSLTLSILLFDTVPQHLCSGLYLLRFFTMMFLLCARFCVLPYGTGPLVYMNLLSQMHPSSCLWLALRKVHPPLRFHGSPVESIMAQLQRCLFA